MIPTHYPGGRAPRVHENAVLHFFIVARALGLTYKPHRFKTPEDPTAGGGAVASGCVHEQVQVLQAMKSNSRMEVSRVHKFTLRGGISCRTRRIARQFARLASILKTREFPCTAAVLRSYTYTKESDGIQGGILQVVSRD